MRFLFAVEDYPISPNSSGGAPSLIYSHLELLAHTGSEIDLLVLQGANHSRGFETFTQRQPETWELVKSWCSSYRTFRLSRGGDVASAPLKNLFVALTAPTRYLCAEINEQTLAAFSQVISEVKPDAIWAEHRVPATLAVEAGADTPVIYSHHDWEWRLGKLRQAKAKSWRTEFNLRLMRKVEEGVVRRAAGIVSASATEAAGIRAAGGKRVVYFPTTYVAADLNVEADEEQQQEEAAVRIIHLGGMKTTANRKGLERFFEVTWPSLCQSQTAKPEMWVIGSLDGASTELQAQLERAGAVCPGFVSDLGSVLRPYDIHIVPWEHDTGTRTRIPVALNYSQALISTEAAAACLPELRSGENCVLVKNLSQMAEQIRGLLADHQRRKSLARAGRASFLRHFTRVAIQPSFDAFITSVAR